MAQTKATRLMELSMPTELAKEVAKSLILARAAAIPSLTGTVGTPNDAMTAVPAAVAATTDTTAAQLTSVNTAITAINNNLADLQAKVNAMLAAERGAGVIAP